ncbi:DNA alkylation repair protein [Flavobacterium ponti]|uniref:DNA alkylation repair protein n=1 Tax=Flavobacterium ponti TaxID=665133 RepID=A0ABV9P799_9FLAO
MNFKEELIKELKANSNRETAIPMENYMKNNFPFLGIKTEKRRAIFKAVYKNINQKSN